MNERSCIVTRKSGDAEELVRFVAAPDGTVTPDLKRRLPGRGCWVTARRDLLERASAKHFARALKTEVSVPADLADRVERLMMEQILGQLGLARKAGQLVLGAVKTEAAARSGHAAMVLHAEDAAADGVRKIAQARHAAEAGGSAPIAAFRGFSSAQLGAALGGENVNHAAILANGANGGLLKRLKALMRYRGETVAQRTDGAETPTKDTE